MHTRFRHQYFIHYDCIITIVIGNRVQSEQISNFGDKI